jgi:hypothetical protein
MEDIYASDIAGPSCLSELNVTENPRVGLLSYDSDGVTDKLYKNLSH